ncbi:hmgA [Symbiodinium natans]|uniref:HmgA protein n=1 Tax=Symbiodinium natans TaxID=878477 RepID=A0A812MCF4_9DINO|nr:hmgA [Symbiodinium natans]
MISEGDICFVNYGEVPPCIHARLVGAHIQNDLFVIITPDYDVYEEQLSNLNPDFTAFHYGGPGLGAAVPAGLNRAHVYAFGAMSAIDYQRLMNQARLYAAGIRAGLGLPPVPNVAPAVPAPAPGAPAVPALPADPLVWVALESRGNARVGSVVVPAGQGLPAGAVNLGDRAIVDAGAGLLVALKQVPQSQVGTMETRDLRVLPLRFDGQGQRRADFNEVVSQMSQDDMPGGKLQLDGPPSALEVVRSMVLRGLTPVTDHEHWVRTHELAKGDRSVYEMEVITRVLEAFITVDQINIPNLKGCELLVRRWQLIREAHRLSPTNPDYSAADVIMGWAYRKGDGVEPTLARYVASELRDQASIAKEARKGVAVSYLSVIPFVFLEESACVRRHRARRKDNLDKTNEVIHALNAMERVFQREAIRELLLDCPSSPYVSDGGGTGSVRAYQRDLVSLPESGAEPLEATALIDDQGREILERFESTMFVGEDVSHGSPIKPYMDDTLRSSPKAYAQFISDIFERGMIDFDRTAASIITPFFVSKKRLRRYFALPPIPASALPAGVGVIAESEGELWYPRMKVVPMGWSWAMWIAQRIHQHQASVALACSPDQVLVDGRPPPSLEAGSPLLIPYADNLNVCGTNQAAVQSAKDKVVEQLRSVGFRVHEEEDASLRVQALGFVIDGEKGEVHPIAARRDKDIAAALILTCYADLRKPWCPTITASDASLSGTAVAALTVESGQVQTIGVCREMWRFKSKDPLAKARDAALCLDPFVHHETVMSLDPAERDPFQLNLDFQHVPVQIACHPEWKLQLACRMHKPEHITLLEGRGTVQAVRHKMRVEGNYGMKHLHLGDNLGMVLAFDRGRAKAVPLLICCRRATAFAIAGDCVFTHRWIPSEHNAADAGSRQWEQEKPSEAAAKSRSKEAVTSLCYPKSKSCFSKEQGRELLWGVLAGAPTKRSLRKALQGPDEATRASKRQAVVAAGKPRNRNEGHTFLETAAVAPRTSEEYLHKWNLFESFCKTQKLKLRKEDEVDYALNLFLNQAFLEGWDISEGVKCMAAVTDRWPALSGRGQLPRTRRSMQGWRNLDPGVTRPPLAWPLVALIALTVLQADQFVACMAILFMFATYVRPGEVFEIRRQDLVKSRSLGQVWSVNLHPSDDLQESKVEVSNETILLDNKEIPWLGAALECMTAISGAALFPTNYTELLDTWHRALKQLGLGSKFAVPHQLRHSGASWDRFKNYRSLLEVKHRGRWAADSSLKRYEQHAMVAQQFEKLAPALKRRAQAAPATLQAMVLAKCGLKR